jgi:hypothetical protein
MSVNSSLFVATQMPASTRPATREHSVQQSPPLLARIASFGPFSRRAYPSSAQRAGSRAPLLCAAVRLVPLGPAKRSANAQSSVVSDNIAAKGGVTAETTSSSVGTVLTTATFGRERLGCSSIGPHGRAHERRAPELRHSACGSTTQEGIPHDHQPTRIH